MSSTPDHRLYQQEVSRAALEPPSELAAQLPRVLAYLVGHGMDAERARQVIEQFTTDVAERRRELAEALR